MSGVRFAPYLKGGRPVTMTIRATADAAARVDAAAKANGMSRALFLIRCADEGYRALVESGQMK